MCVSLNCCFHHWTVVLITKFPLMLKFWHLNIWSSHGTSWIFIFPWPMVPVWPFFLSVSPIPGQCYQEIWTSHLTEILAEAKDATLSNLDKQRNRTEPTWKVVTWLEQREFPGNLLTQVCKWLTQNVIESLQLSCLQILLPVIIYAFALFLLSALPLNLSKKSHARLLQNSSWQPAVWDHTDSLEQEVWILEQSPTISAVRLLSVRDENCSLSQNTRPFFSLFLTLWKYNSVLTGELGVWFSCASCCESAQ